MSNLNDPNMLKSLDHLRALIFNMGNLAKLSKAEFDESQHPRDESGRFTSGGGGGGQEGKGKEPSAAERVKALDDAMQAVRDGDIDFTESVLHDAGKDLIKDPDGEIDYEASARAAIKEIGNWDSNNPILLANVDFNREEDKLRGEKEKSTISGDISKEFKEFDESKHPRGADGKFTSGGGETGGESTSGEATSMRGQLHRTLDERNADTWGQVLNGGFSQLLHNRGVAAKDAVMNLGRKMEDHGYPETSEALFEAGRIMREEGLETDKDARTIAEEMEVDLDTLDTRIYRSAEMKQINDQFDGWKGAHRKKITDSGDITKYIRHEGSKWTVYSEDGKPMGTYGSEAEAKKRLAQVEAFKHMNRKSIDDLRNMGAKLRKDDLVREDMAVASPPIRDPKNVKPFIEEKDYINPNSNMVENVSPIITGLKGTRQATSISGDSSGKGPGASIGGIEPV